MADIETREGVVQSVTDKYDGAVQVDGQWWSYTKNRKPDAVWHEPKKGMTIRMHLNPWEKDDGSVKYYVVGIEDISPFEDTTDYAGPDAPDVGTRKEPFRSPIQIMRSDALRCATDCVIATAKGEVGTEAMAVAILAQAVYFTTFIEGGFD